MIIAKYLHHLSICWAVLFLAPAATMAFDVTFGFTGVVTDVDAALAVEFSPGEVIVGSYTFESTTADSDPGDPVFGIYDNAITTFTATFGGDYTVTQGLDNDIFVGNGFNDSYSVFLTNPTAPTVAGLNLGALFITLVDTDSAVFASDALPLTPPDLSAFEVNVSGTVFFDDPDNKSMNFALTSLTLIPEPTAILVDIKPGSFPNSVNLKSKGVLPVAILGTVDFDVNDVNIAKLMFGDPNSGAPLSPVRSAFEDVSDDGFEDLSLKFSVADLVESGALGPLTMEAC